MIKIALDLIIRQIENGRESSRGIADAHDAARRIEHGAGLNSLFQCRIFFDFRNRLFLGVDLGFEWRIRRGHKKIPRNLFGDLVEVIFVGLLYGAVLFAQRDMPSPINVES